MEKAIANMPSKPSPSPAAAATANNDCNNEAITKPTNKPHNDHMEIFFFFYFCFKGIAIANNLTLPIIIIVFFILNNKTRKKKKNNVYSLAQAAAKGIVLIHSLLPPPSSLSTQPTPCHHIHPSNLQTKSFRQSFTQLKTQSSH